MTKNFKFGKYQFQGYFVKAGHGYEIGYKFAGKTYFVSNFIDYSEANKWWSASQKYMRHFCKYKFYPKMNTKFFGTFMGNYMYNHYYSFLKTVIAKNYSFSSKNYKKDYARYSKFKDAFAA